MTSGIILSTERLGLRELTEADLPALSAILQDPGAMVAYEGPFSDDEVVAWLGNMQESYRTHGFGLWAAVLRETGKMVGQCGLMKQDQVGTTVHEVGYLFNRECWHRGLAVEAASAVRDFAFNATQADTLYSHVRDTNIASMNVAIRLGMTVQSRFVKTYRGVVMPHLAFGISREVWSVRSAPTA